MTVNREGAKKTTGKKLLWGGVIAGAVIIAVVIGILLLSQGANMRFTLAPQKLTLEIGQSQQLEIKGEGQIVATSWTSSAPSVVTVDGQGCVTAAAAGSAKVTAVVCAEEGEYMASVRVKVTGGSGEQAHVYGDLVSDVELVHRFDIDSVEGSVAVNKVAGTLTYAGSSETGVYFAAGADKTHARNWTMTGTITKQDIDSSLFLSFGVIDESGKEQWFCLLDNTMALQRYWNWWLTIQDNDGYRVMHNEAGSDFFFHRNDVLNYKLVLQGDVLKVYFGNGSQPLALAWNLDLTYENYGHFAAGSSYQLAIATVDPCAMVISDLDVQTSDDYKGAGSGSFNVYSVNGSLIPDEQAGTIVYPGKGNTELVFAADSNATHAKSWELSGTVTKENAADSLFLSFGVIDASGKDQWFCLLNESTMSPQRYWNWYENRIRTDGTNVIFNAAADAFFGGSGNTSAVLDYKVVLEKDVLKVYFGNDTQPMKLAWYLPLTEETYGGFTAGGSYQLAINTVDPLVMTMSNVSVTTRETEQVFRIRYEGVDGMENTNPTTYTHATASSIVLADLADKADVQFTGWYIGDTRVMTLQDQSGDITLTAGWGTRYFNVQSTTGAVTADVNAGTLTYDGIGNTEVYLKATPTEVCATNWQMTGTIKKENMASSLFFSFGVLDESGKEQWFCFLENGLSRQRYWNWWDTAVWPNGTDILENSAQYNFFQKTSDTLSYLVQLEGDVLYVYFGSSPDELYLTWSLDLTKDTYGGFAAGSSYQLAINTVDPCAMVISGVTAVGSDEAIALPEEPDGLFYIYSKSSSITADNQAGTLTYAGTGNTELYFKADKTVTHAKKWEATGTITKEDATKSLFFSFGVKDQNGKDQWFCILNESTVSLQRYWNWYTNRKFCDGTEIIYNSAANAFFGASSNTSAVLEYKIVLEDDVLKVYFGNAENELSLAWDLDLTKDTYGGFAADSAYMLALNSVDPCAMVISDVKVVTDELYTGQTDMTWDWFGAQYAEENAEDFALNGNDGTTTLFIGDSFFDVAFWNNFYTDLAGKDAVIGGIGGSTTDDWYHYSKFGLFLDGSGVAPKNIVVNLGNNDYFNDGLTAEQALENYTAYFGLLREHYPDTNFYIFSTVARTGSYTNANAAAEVAEGNSLLDAWCAGKDWITFIDITGLIPTSGLYDGIHPNDEYYNTVYLAKLLEAGCVIEDITFEEGHCFYIDSKSDSITADPEAGTLTYAGANSTELYFRANHLAVYATNWQMTGTITKANAASSLFLSFGVRDSAGKDQWFCLLNESTVSLQRYWNWYTNRKFCDGTEIIYNSAANAFFGASSNTSAVLDYMVTLEGDVLKVYFGNANTKLTLAWVLDLTKDTYGGFTAGSSYQLAINTVDPCAMVISDVTAVGSDEPIELPAEPEEPETPSGITWETARVSDYGGEALYDMGTRRILSSYIYVTPGTTITLSDTSYQFVLYGYTYDASSDTYTYCGNNSYIDCDPNTSANWGTSYTFGETVTFANGNTVNLPLYVRICIRHTDNASTTPLSMGDNITVTGVTEPEEPSITWETARVSDYGGEALYDMGTRRILSSYIYVTPGTTIKLSDTSYQFVLYGYTYDEETDSYTYCGNNSYIDCDPNTSSNWGTSYTFGETVTFANGNTVNLPLYVRICIRHTDNASTTPLSMGDNITVTGVTEPEEPSITWETARVSDYGGEALYDMGTRRILSSYIYVTPGTTIKLSDTSYQFVLYGYTYDEETDSYTYCGNNSYIDCDPNTSSNWGTSYTFGETVTFANGNTVSLPLYVRICIRHTDNASTTPLSMGDNITVTESGDGVDPAWDAYGEDSAQARAERLAAFGTEDITTVFIGDSFFDTTQGFWGTYAIDLSGKDALVLGIGGSTAQDWYNYMVGDTFMDGTGIQPKNIVVNLGNNDYYNDYSNVASSEEAVMARFKKLYNKLHENYPDAMLYVYSTVARTGTYANTASEASLTAGNALLKTWCQDQDWITFIDLSDSTIELRDNIHPKDLYYSTVYLPKLLEAGCQLEEGDGITWETARVSDAGGEPLYDMGTRRIVSSHIKVEPGTTITLSDSSYQFVLYGYTYDEATGTVSYCGSNSYIDCDPNTSANWGTSYTFGDSVTFASGSTVDTSELYVRICIRHTDNASTTPLSMGDNITVTTPEAAVVTRHMSLRQFLPVSSEQERLLSILTAAIAL